VVQDALLKLARGGLVIPADVAGNPESERRVMSAWLHKVVRNGCMDMIKAEGRRRTRERASAAPEAAPERVPEVEMEDTQGTVRAAIAALPVEQREVLSLRLFEEKSYRDIAEVTGKKVGTIGWLISEGLQALALRLGPALGEVGGSSMNIGTTSGGA
jgi:RNA polymerase sigma-70 factor (ECF subfamily)